MLNAFITRHITDATLTWSQAFPEGLASFVLIGELRRRRPSRVWTARSRLVPPNPLQSSLRTTRARRPARLCCPSCISHPIEGTQDPSHSRHNASGKRGTPKNWKFKKKLKTKVNTASDVWGFFKKKKKHLNRLTAVLWQYSVMELINTLNRIVHLHIHIFNFAVFLLLQM